MPEQSHGYEWLVLHPRGTVSINVTDDADKDDWVDLRMARIGDIRKFGNWIEDADEQFREAEAKVRVDVGMDEAMANLLQELRSTNPTAGAVVQGPGAFKVEADYMGALQRLILGKFNPYPPIYAAMLDELGGRLVEDLSTLPGFALTQPPLTLILAHWQTAPTSPKAEATPPQRARPRR